MPEILTAPAVITSIDTSNCCEDCPDVNVRPPEKSECPYFDATGGVPVCTREGGIDEQLRNFIGPVSLVGSEVRVEINIKLH